MYHTVQQLYRGHEDLGFFAPKLHPKTSSIHIYFVTHTVGSIGYA